ncbi:MAG: thermonuclease family protein [Planctomycetes bacterium]|nr:thermonuclease family protein [Planctomycetota bacterium]
MRTLVILLLISVTLAPAHALQSTPLKILRIIDGDSIVVEGSAGGAAVPISIRLKYLDTPEMRDGNKNNPYGKLAKECLTELLHKNVRVQLFTSKKYFSADSHGRVLAIVYAVHTNGNKTCIQGHMIKNGMSVYWKKFGKSTKHYDAKWMQLEKQAELHAAGLWLKQRTWMLKKRAEN